MPPRGAGKLQGDATIIDGTVKNRPDDSEPGTAETNEDHITEFEKQLERLQAIALDANFSSGSLVGDIRDVLLDTFKLRPKAWSQHSEAEQRDLAKALENVAKTVISKVVLVVAEQDEISVSATLKGYSAKGGTFKLNAEARGDQETALQLFDMDGHDVIIMSADSARFTGQAKPAAVEPDQPGLSLEPPVGEDEDVAEAGGDNETADDESVEGAIANLSDSIVVEEETPQEV